MHFRIDIIVGAPRLMLIGILIVMFPRYVIAEKEHFITTRGSCCLTRADDYASGACAYVSRA